MSHEPNSFLALDPADLPWREMSPGIEVATVHRDRERDHSMMYLRFAPGARAPRHIHPEGEQYHVISGTVVDENGSFGPGCIVNNPPGSVHEPWSPDGALVLVNWFGRLSAYEEEA